MNVSEAPRDVRRAAYAQERSERASGKWEPLKPMSTGQITAARELTAEREGPPSIGGWVRKVEHVYRNGWMSVLVRTIEHTSLGVTIEHAAIRTALQAELGWKEMQRIKDEIFGTDRMAIEVYPRKTDLIDEADMYHLWVFPAGFRFDFGLGRGQR